MGTLNLFPARVAIGQVQPNGQVLATPEFSRALSGVLDRLGGTNGHGTDDLGVEAASVATLAQARQLAQTVAHLEQQIAQLAGQLAGLQEAAKQAEALALAPANPHAAECRKMAAELELRIETIPDYGAALAELRKKETNWGSPGAIGSVKPNSGAFTTLSANGGTALSRTDSSDTLTLSRAGTAAGKGTLGADSNFALRVLNGAGGVVLWLWQSGKRVEARPEGLVSEAGFGCNGKDPQPAYAVGAAATDLATVVALANNLRTALRNNGIAS